MDLKAFLVLRIAVDKFTSASRQVSSVTSAKRLGSHIDGLSGLDRRSETP